MRREAAARVMIELSPAVLQTVAFQALMIWPVGRVYRRAGLNPFWALLLLIPLFGLFAALAPLGHKAWPSLPPRPPKPPRRTREGLR
jgi:hypothetical protein